VIYRGSEVPAGSFPVENEVMMAAHESSDHAADHEQQGLGDITLEQLRADVMRLSRQTDTGSPLAAFMDTRRVRDRIYRLLDRRLWPREQADLYFLLACIHAVMGQNANRLGYPDAAEELIRSGWAYANAIDHNPLRAMLRAKLSSFHYWRGRFREASDLAADGLRYVSDGPSAAELQLNYARAMARQGDVDAARHAVGVGQDAQVSGYQDDLMAIGGNMFNQYLATMHTVAGNALGDTGNDRHDAAGQLERAISLYDEDPAPGEKHIFFGKPQASTHLALVRLKSGDLDGASTALADVLILPPEHRITELTTRLAVIRDELATPAFHGSPQARNLGDQIENFSRETVTASLHSLSG
jgi:tetratricopeptide (TPR) repeat protein